jgi:cold-inducible RNA-binding protein
LEITEVALAFFEHPKPDLRCIPFFFEASQSRNFSNIPHKVRKKEKLLMSTKLYVGNLSFNTSASDLEKMFGESGTVQSTNIIEDRETGRSRGFGFVEMSSSEEAKAAITALDGKEVDGRNLKVNEAKPQEKRSGGGGGNYGGSGGYGGGKNRW